MPTYVVRAHDLTPLQRADVAARITDAHAQATGAPRSFAQVLLEDVDDASHFIGGQPADQRTVFVHGHIRAGRSAELTEVLARSVRDAVVEGAGRPADQVWVYLSEIPEARVVEFGHTLPAPGEEDAWIEALPTELRERLQRLSR